MGFQLPKSLLDIKFQVLKTGDINTHLASQWASHSTVIAECPSVRRLIVQCGPIKRGQLHCVMPAELHMAGGYHSSRARESDAWSVLSTNPSFLVQYRTWPPTHLQLKYDSYNVYYIYIYTYKCDLSTVWTRWDLLLLWSRSYLCLIDWSAVQTGWDLYW